MQDTTNRRHAGPSPELLSQFSAIVGDAHALTDPDQQMPYLQEWRDQFVGVSPLVLRPGTTREVSDILALANSTGTAIVPQSGNTGLVGGQIPDESGREIVISLTRLNCIRDINPLASTMTVEAGVTLQQARDAAADVDRLLALALPSQGTCCIGGNLATNAGGVNVLAYGNARAQALGLEVVLADGRIWDGMRALMKDNTGYDLKDLFIGSEGTLGIITGAVLKLFPLPAEKTTALVGLDTVEQALELFNIAKSHGAGQLTAFELMSRICIDFVTRHVPGNRDPFGTQYPWYVLLELSGLQADGAAQAMMEGLLTEALERELVRDATIAASLTQSQDFWRLRESVSEAQKPEGGNIKHDISVPISKIPEFIQRADVCVERVCPGARTVALGHMGDGNLHYNVAQPPGMDKRAFLELWHDMADAVHAIVMEYGGSISAEHGIGRLKREELAAVKSPVDMALMHGLKDLFDPNGILNPGKLL